LLTLEDPYECSLETDIVSPHSHNCLTSSNILPLREDGRKNVKRKKK
jgi:hypothetical protein